MARYIDGFLLPVPKGKIAEYKRMAAQAGKVWMKYGALEFVECVGEDLKKTKWCVAFPQLLKTKPGETVVFSFIAFKSRKHRDEVNAKVMKDPLMNDPAMKDKPMPFDMKRMGYGGFETLVDYRK